MDYSNLVTKGYLIIRSFLSEREIAVFKTDYEIQKNLKFSQNENNYDIIPTTAHNYILNKLDEMMGLVRYKTGVVTHILISPSYYYNNIESARLYYHQDHESFYLLQQNYHYLNFWIPVSKPSPAHSGLIVVPMDKLAELIPDYMHKIINNGATSYYPEGDITRVVNDNDDSEYVLPVNITTIQEIPELHEGDLLLMRGDLIHSTEDNLTNRTAISIRYTNGSLPISRELFFSGGQKKQEILNGTPHLIELVNSRFDDRNVEVMTAWDFF